MRTSKNWISCGVGNGKYIAFLMVVGLAACETTSVVRELNVAGQKVRYTMQSCKPGIKWDGLSLTLEGLQVPNLSKGDLSFNIGKLNYSDKAIREIRDTVYFYEGLLNQTCATLVRLEGQDAIERYSLHRDTLLSGLATTLSNVQQAKSESAAEAAARAGRAAGQAEGATPKAAESTK